MTDTALLSEVKKRLSVTGDFQDELLQGYIGDVKAYLVSAGVSETTLDSDKSVGVISKGVYDIWVNDKFSEFFIQRAIQLACEGEEDV